jgi:hypothetical protein
MKQKDIIVIIAVAAGGYLVYTYLKDQGMLPEWLGGAPKPGEKPDQATNGGNGKDKPTEEAPVSTLRSELLSRAEGNPYLIQQKMDAHQWNYYRNIARPPALSGEQFASAFPGDTAQQQMTVDEFLSALKGVGLGAIVPARPVASMTFGGNLGNYGLPQRRRGGWIQ